MKNKILWVFIIVFIIAASSGFFIGRYYTIRRNITLYFEEIPEKIPTKLINSRVIVFNPLYASYLYVKEKFFGSPLGINKPRLEYFSKPSELSLIEAYYLLKKDKITIFDPQTEKFLSLAEFYEIGKKIHHKFEEKFVIYKDLRDKGYIPRPGLKFGADFVAIDVEAYGDSPIKKYT